MSNQITDKQKRYKRSKGGGVYEVGVGSRADSWLLRVQKDGRRRDFGLGPCSNTSLTQARAKAAALRAQLDAGLDPVAEKRKLAETPTFAEAAVIVHAKQTADSKAGKHVKQWLSLIEAYANPKIGKIRIDRVTEGDVGLVLDSIWLNKPATAKKVQHNVLTVLDWAYGLDYRPAPFNLKKLKAVLGKPSKLKQVKHHNSLPWKEVPAFMKLLQARSGAGVLALRLAVLTAARSGEIRGATWDEFDLIARTWTIPADRMKAGRMHVVPLSSGAMAVLRDAQAVRIKDRRHVFLTGTVDKPMSDMTMTAVIRRMGRKGEVTAHGFRSSFRNWVAATCGTTEREAAEFSLAHGVKNAVEGSYLTDTLFDRRKALMTAWSDYCLGDASTLKSSLPDNVVKLDEGHG